MSPTLATLAIAEPPMALFTDKTTILETRFGRIEVSASATITMPQGPHGFASFRRFALANIPGAEDSTLKMFQSLDDEGLTFIVLPLDKDSGAIAAEDIAEAGETHGIAEENLAILLIVTVRQGENGDIVKTANLRAPLLVDVSTRVARQHIFLNNNYPVRQPI